MEKSSNEVEQPNINDAYSKENDKNEKIETIEISVISKENLTSNNKLDNSDEVILYLTI